jgi:hypothetical protein
MPLGKNCVSVYNRVKAVNLRPHSNMLQIFLSAQHDLVVESDILDMRIERAYLWLIICEEWGKL